MALATVTPTRGEHHYPCESCGADLRFAPGQERLVCDHCGHVQDIPEATGRGLRLLRELPLGAALEGTLGEDATGESRTLSCPNCGATLEIGPDAQAAECPFCATPVVTDTGPRRAIRPQGLVPFKVTETEARAALGQWLGSLWFAPSGLASYARRGRRMTGVYAPFWTFDALSRSRYAGQRGDAYHETQMVSVMVNGRPERRAQQVRRIRWSPAQGAVARGFDDVLVYASRSLPAAEIEALRPWDLAELREYRPDYLAGLTAEAYTVELREGHHIARAAMARVIETDVRRDIGGDAQQIHRIDTEFSGESCKHILLPVWTAAYRYKGRAFRFVVNAQTGRVQGERPWSPWKIAFAVLLAALAAGLFYWYGETRGLFDQVRVQTGY